MRTLTLGVMLLSSLAAAEVPQLSASFGYHAQLFSTRGVDFFATNDTLSAYRAAVGTGLGLPYGRLDVEVAFSSGEMSANSHVNLPVEFFLKGFSLAGTYRLPIRSWFHPYAQVAGGFDWATLTVVNDARLTQTVLTPSGSGLLGVQFNVRMGTGPERRLPWLVFDLGAGVVLRPPAAFNAMGPQAPEKPPADALPVATVNLGAVPLTGFTARLLVGVRY